MSKLLMNLRYVTDEEAAEVRELLNRHQIAYYETPPNRWGITVGAIWLEDHGQFPAARRLLDRYQAERGARVRAEHEAARARGELETLAERIRREPARVLFYFAAVAAIAALMTVPFIQVALGD
ncbi:DUF6164 family protein [Thiococcus pfennigii]|uniref:DUF6164 family protein n=1 Tax=Thiococcus pfennigii TaxID=1057 RepID=UPI001904D409|nr:DUF6164 family protein [Thiococcus pfennigii]MBK1700839.1 hypothetical protein [Thiococcus pfennigii]MBK1732070.1 hypothetical protein [Thiococcus pfennigii]